MITYELLSYQDAKRLWMEIVGGVPSPELTWGPHWGGYPVPGQRCWRMVKDGVDQGFLSLEPKGPYEWQMVTALRTEAQRRGLRPKFREFYIHKAFSDPNAECISAEILPGSFYDHNKRDPGFPWRVAGEIWYPRQKLLIALSRDDAVRHGLIPHQVFAPEPLWPGFCWVDSGLGDRWKVWNGYSWDKLGVRPANERTVIEHPYHDIDSSTR